MMPEYKWVRLSVFLSSLLVLPGCSALNFLNVDAVDDNVDYRKSVNSVKALAIPPGLSSPGFNDTYASVQNRSGSTSVQNNATSLSSAGSTQSEESTTLASSAIQHNATPVSVASRPTPAATASSGRSVSLGAALLEQSESAERATPATRAASRAAKPESPVSQARQAATANASRPAAITSSSARSTGSMQVAMMRLNSGEPALAVNAPYAKTWNSLPPVIAETKFKISKQQQDQGIYTAVYQGKATANLQTGKTYLILVAENAARQSFIGVANDNGKPASDSVANEVLSQFKAQFER